MKKIVQIAICLVWMGAMSCQQNPLDESRIETSKIKGNHDYMEFESEKAFSQMLDALSQKTQTQLDEWEKQQGFVSLRKRYNEVIKAEEINGDNGLKPLKSEEATLYTAAYIPSEYGGLEPNIADLRKMAVVNIDGIVKIGDVFHQFRKDQTKSLPDKPYAIDEVAMLKSAISSNTSTGLTVYPVRITRKLISDVKENKSARLGGVLSGSRGCESYSGSPQEWHLIANEEILEAERGGDETVCDPGYTYNPTTGQLQVGVNCRTVYNPNLHEFQARLRIRTLKRGFWGNWYDRSSSEQRANGHWKLQPNSVVAPGWNSGNIGTVTNPFADNNYNVTNTFGEQAVVDFIFWTSSLTATISSPNSNISLDPSSYHEVSWNSYNCQCNIP